MAYMTPVVPTPPYTGTVLPTHLLGIGPWNDVVNFRGAANYGITPGNRPATPVLNLPTADNLSVTLRLGAGSEAKTSHFFERHQAVVIDENVTDLWWRRRDPRRLVVDGIGRFNTTTVDLNLAAGGVGVDASITYTDYQGLLEDRLVMSYLTPSVPVVPATVPPTMTTATTMWAAGTLITDVLRWVVPTNLGLDLTGVQAATPDITATLKHPFQIPLGTRIAEVMKNLLTVSNTAWEWWVDMPTTDADRPRLRLATSRGADRGITLFDIGGQGPIETWSLQRSGDKYANALMFMGGTGGVVYTLPEQIAVYGQRDTTETDTSLLGNIVQIRAAAQTRLAALAAPTPSYEVVLRQSFWEGRTHIDVGDWVTIHLELGAEVVHGKYRVSQIQIDIDGNGFETVTLTLGTRRPDRDPRSRASLAARLVRYLTNYVVPPGADISP